MAPKELRINPELAAQRIEPRRRGMALQKQEPKFPSPREHRVSERLELRDRVEREPGELVAGYLIERGKASGWVLGRRRGVCRGLGSKPSGRVSQRRGRDKGSLEELGECFEAVAGEEALRCGDVGMAQDLVGVLSRGDSNDWIDGVSEGSLPGSKGSHG